LRPPITFKRQKSKNLDNEYNPVQWEANKELYEIHAYKSDEE